MSSISSISSQASALSSAYSQINSTLGIPTQMQNQIPVADQAQLYMQQNAQNASAQNQASSTSSSNSSNNGSLNVLA